MLTEEEIVTPGDVLAKEINWLKKVIQRRFDLLYDRTYTPSRLGEDGRQVYDSTITLRYDPVETILPEKLPRGNMYCEFIKKHDLGFEERLLLVLSIAVHLSPGLFSKNYREEALKHPQFGLTPGQGFQGMVPTALTFIFLLCGADIDKITKSYGWLSDKGILIKEKVIRIEPELSGDPFFSGKIILSKAYFDLFTGGK